MKKTHHQLVADLKKLGLRFTYFTKETIGNYTQEDAIWNYKDAIVHIPMIHHLVQNVPIRNHKDSLSSIFFQKIFGIRFPLVVFDFEATPYTQTTVFTQLGFVLVVHNEALALTPERTKVITHYFIGACRFLSLFSPIIRWLLKRNYKVLMNTDIPLRERRGTLRSWGYEFRPSDYLSVENLGAQNWIAPTSGSPFHTEEISVQSLTDTPTLVGRSDHLGLRIEKDGSHLSFYPRLCSHEGADIDNAPCVKGSLVCPWHGKRVPKMAQIDLNDSDAVTLTTHHRIQLAQGILKIEQRDSRTPTLQ